MKYIIGHYRKCDFITMTGTLFAFIGIIIALNSHFIAAVFCLLCSGICDAFDGRVARKYKASKEQKVYGVQLDSLSDVICFGVFPAVLVSLISHNFISYLISAFYLLCGVVRLAYFNTMNCLPNNKKNIFIGVPITTVSIILPIIIFVFRFINFQLLTYILPIILLLLGISFVLRIEIKKPDISKILNKIFNKYTVTFVFFPLIMTILSDLFWKLNDFNSNAYIDVFTTIINNFLPFLFISIIFMLLTLFFISITNDSKKSKIIVILITTIFLVINDIKYKMMGIPIQINDIGYLNSDNINMIGVSVTIGAWFIKTIIKAICMIVICAILCYVDKYHHFSFENKKKRYISIIVSIVLLIIPFLFKFNYFMLEKVYRMSEEDALKINDVTKMYYQKGYFQGMYLDKLSNYVIMPKNYSVKKAKKTLHNVSKDYSKGKWQKANVVVLLSETFSDPQLLNGIKYDKELMPNIKKYENDDDKIVTNLLVNPYGGVSVNSEFEVLTGGSLAFFSNGFIPYTQYYTLLQKGKNQSLINEFHNNGYETMYLTPWGKVSYKSEYVYNILGVDKKIYGDSLKGKKKGYYYSDESLMNDIYNQLKDTKDGKYKFIMAASGQNHTPYYGKYKENEYDINIVKTQFDDETTKAYRSYGQGIYDADKALDQLYNLIQKLETPTIVVMFGDHHPFMFRSDGTNGYLKDSYFNTEDKNRNDIRLHTTKAVILSNFGLDKDDDLEFINSSYLGAYVLNKMDLDVSDYFKFIDYSRKKIPVFNRNVVYDYKNDKIINMNKISKDQKKALNDYRTVQYYKFYDYNK